MQIGHNKLNRGDKCRIVLSKLSTFFHYFPLRNAFLANLVPRALFPGLGSGASASKAREKRAEDEVDFSHSMQYGITDW